MYNLKLAIRHLLRQRTGTVINVVGLSLSLAVCLLIALFVQYEYAFENHNNQAGHLCRLLNIHNGQRTPIHPIASFHPLSDAVPEMKNGVMVQYLPEVFFVVENEQRILPKAMFSTDEYLSLFKINMLEGGEHPLADESSAVISRSTARILFPYSSAIGKTLRYENRYDFHIKGVFEDVPVTASYRPNVIMNIHAKKSLEYFEYTSMRNQSTQFFFLLPENADRKKVADKAAEQAKIIYERPDYTTMFQFQPLHDIHLYSSDTLWDFVERSDSKTVHLFILVATLVLLIAVFNFVNLSVALRDKRNFNTGMQKIMGADVKNIFGYLLIETSLLIGTCLVMALFLTAAALPDFNRLMNSEIRFSLANPVLWTTIAIIAVFNILVPVSVQLYNQMHVNPSAAIRNKGRTVPKRDRISVAQSLTMAQITISICLIIGVIGINKQFDLLLWKKLGFDKENLVTINNPWNERVVNRYGTYKQELEKLTAVSGVTGTWNPPGYNLNNGLSLKYESGGETVELKAYRSPADVDFFNVMRVRFLLGGSFSATDSAKAVINETCRKDLRAENSIGLKVTSDVDGKTYEICGVIEDIQNRSLHNTGQPAIYYLYPELGSFIVRLKPGDTRKTVAEMERLWKQIEPDQPFRLSFVDEDLQANYTREIRTQKLLTIMSLLAIFISMLGLYGLSMQIIQRRTKEIGIRKVNGAAISEILAMLNRRFVIWVLVAFVIAVPLSYYAITRWLETFAYKTALSWWIFALGGAAALLVALITVSRQSWRAATRNPVEALRYE